MRRIIQYIIERLNSSTVIALLIFFVFIFAYNEIIVLLRWFISDQMKVLLSDKLICAAIGTAVVGLLNKK